MLTYDLSLLRTESLSFLCYMLHICYTCIARSCGRGIHGQTVLKHCTTMCICGMTMSCDFHQVPEWTKCTSRKERKEKKVEKPFYSDSEGESGPTESADSGKSGENLTIEYLSI